MVVILQTDGDVNFHFLNLMIVFIKFHYNLKITNHFKRHRETDPEPEVDALFRQEMELSRMAQSKVDKKKRKAIYDDWQE